MSDARQRFFAVMGNINPLAIVFLLCVGFSLLTYLIPGGEFDRRTVMVMGRERLIVVPGSFHPVPGEPAGLPAALDRLHARRASRAPSGPS